MLSRRTGPPTGKDETEHKAGASLWKGGGRQEALFEMGFEGV